ncbi:MAG: hypothetical protein ABJE80_24710 [Reichenbachiella sp.]|uniref:hypothetical protein n=1 Tax=Reichenbachiella sp. TaxID=2184521 RepID=UPI003264B472
MKYFYSLVLTFLMIGQLHAQKDAPSWLDPYQRQDQYPADSYLTGLSSELVGKNQSLADIYGQLNQLSRNQIIESVRVDVKAETEMNISIVNTESTQRLDQISVSTSEAELVGLKFENYYNKKKKLAFSFSYVSIEELINYNLDIIRVSTSEIDENIVKSQEALTSGRKGRVIELLYESQVKLNQINEAAIVLLALSQENRIDFPKIREMRSSVADLTDKALTTGKLKIGELANHLSYQLQLQLGEEPINVCQATITFQDSGKESDFSIELRNKSLNTLGELGIAQLSESECQLTYEGAFDESNELATVTVNLVDATGTAKMGISTKVPMDVLDLGTTNFLPKNFKYIDVLSSIKPSHTKSDYVIKKVDLFDYPIEVDVVKGEELLADIPLAFTIKREERVEFETTLSSDKSGKASLMLNTDQLPLSGDFVLTTMIDVASLLDIPTSSGFYQKVVLDHPPYSIENKIQVIAPTVYVKSSEFSLGNERRIPILAPSVKKELAELDYQFIDTKAGADYVVEIEAATREGQRNDIASFSYLDATVSMQDLKTGKEIYKYSVSNVKGGGADYNTADAKAYEKAKKMIANDLSYKLEFGD